MLLVRLLLFMAIAVIVVAAAAYLITKNRRYLIFIRQTLVFALIFFVGVLLFFAFERLILIV